MVLILFTEIFSRQRGNDLGRWKKIRRRVLRRQETRVRNFLLAEREKIRRLMDEWKTAWERNHNKLARTRERIFLGKRKNCQINLIAKWEQRKDYMKLGFIF